MTALETISQHLEATQQLASAASVGKWFAMHEGSFMGCKALAFSCVLAEHAAPEDWVAKELDPEDADFIAYARTALLIYAEALKAMTEQLEIIEGNNACDNAAAASERATRALKAVAELLEGKK